MPPKAQKKKKSKLEKAAEAVISAGPFKLALAIGNDDEGKRALETLNGALKRARDEDIASDSEPEVDEEEEERKRKNAAARKAKEVVEEDIWQQILDELAQDIFFVPPPEEAKPPDSNTSECIIFYGKLLKNATLKCGSYWAKLTTHVEAFCATILRRVKNIHAVSTVMKAKSAENQDWPAKQALISEWQDYQKVFGLSLDHIVDMFSVGRLLNEYPRLQGFSAPERLLNHVSGIRMRIQASAEMASRFCVMINTVNPQKPVGVSLEEAKAVQASVAERRRKRKARIAMQRSKKKKASKKKTAVVVSEDPQSEDPLVPVPGVSTVDADHSSVQVDSSSDSSSDSESEHEAPTVPQPEESQPEEPQQEAPKEAEKQTQPPFSVIHQKVPPLPPQTEEKLKRLLFPDVPVPMEH